jgi:hypothetical protein
MLCLLTQVCNSLTHYDILFIHIPLCKDTVAVFVNAVPRKGNDGHCFQNKHDVFWNDDAIL